MQLWLKIDKADCFKFILLNMIISSFCSRYSPQFVKDNQNQNSKHNLGCNDVQNIGFSAFLHVPLWKKLFLLVKSVRTYWKGLVVQECQQVQEVQGSLGVLQSHNSMCLGYPFLPLDQQSLESLVDHDLLNMWQTRWLTECEPKYHCIILHYKVTLLTLLFLISLNLYMFYLNQNLRFLVDLGVPGDLEILGHQGYRDYHWNPDHLVDLQPIRVQMINTGRLFWINSIVFWSGGVGVELPWTAVPTLLTYAGGPGGPGSPWSP